MKNPQAFEVVKDKDFKIPDAVVEILNNDRTATFIPNYWQTSDGSKKRIYYNVSNLKRWKYPLAEKFIELLDYRCEQRKSIKVCFNPSSLSFGTLRSKPGY